MLKKATFLMLGLVSVGFIAGCAGSGTTAAEIANSYGVLSPSATTDIFQSGQADQMVDRAQTKIRNRVAGSGKDRILVTEYIIQGQVYRVDVRRAVDPTHNVAWDRLRYARCSQGPNQWVISWGHLIKTWSYPKNHSYEGQPSVAYRAWRGRDDRVRGVKVTSGKRLDWNPTDGAVNLVIRTCEWPFVSMWFRGLTSDGRRPAGGVLPPDRTPENESISAPDGRWIMESAGPGTLCPTVVDGRGYFINLKLYDILIP